MVFSMLPLRMLGLLLLMFLLCDADSRCPTNSNPLILDPPEIIGEYGTTVFVNCSSTIEDHDGIHWIYGNESYIEEDFNFITKSLLLSDWNVAQCKVKLNDSSDIECSKDLNITVYKNPDNVFLYPTKYGNFTEYYLQCDIINVAPVQNLVVRWYKDNQNIKEDSFTNKAKTPVSESSVLIDNINREDNGAQFRCEVQLDFGPYGPQSPVISSNIHIVSVHYAPEFKNKTEKHDIYVGEGDNVTLNCEAEGNPPPVFHWTNDRVNILENTNNLYINQVNTSASYNCTATNVLGSVHKSIFIHVEKTTMAKAIPEASTPINCPLTLTPDEIVVRFGDPASVNCSTSATDILGMGWEAALGGTAFSHAFAVTWSVDKLEDWTMEPKCYVTLINNSQCIMTPFITLYKTPDIVSVSASNHGPMVEGAEHELKCSIINVAPVKNLKVKWYRGIETVHTQTFNYLSLTPVNESSTLRVTPERSYNGAHFRCEAELHLGPNGTELIPTTSSAPYIAVVHYAPVFKEGNYTKEVTLGENVTFGCSAEGNPPPEIEWKYESAVNVGETTWGRQKNITVTGATSTNGGVYICIATNKVGSDTRSVTLSVKDKTSADPSYRWLLLLLFVVIVIILSSICLIYLKQKKKHGKYSFIKTNDDLGIPMTTKSAGK